MAAQIPLKLVTSPSNIVARLDGLATGGTDFIEPDLVLGEVTGTAGVPVGTSMTQTLTNKTLTAPKIDEIRDTVNSDVVAQFFSAGATDVNYHTFTGAPSGSFPSIEPGGADANINLLVRGKGASGEVRIRTRGVTAEAVNLTQTQTLTNKTLTAPVIGDLSAMQHDHHNATTGGQLDARTCFLPGAGNAALFSATQASDTTNVGASSVTFQAITATTPTIPANALTNTVTFEIKLTGKYTTDGAARTAQFIVSRDGTNHYYTTGAITLGNAVTDNRFQLEIQMTCTATGITGVMRSVTVQGYIQGASAPAPATFVVTAPQTLTIDTTTDNNIVIGVIRDVGSGAGNTITLESYTITKLN